MYRKFQSKYGLYLIDGTKNCAGGLKEDGEGVQSTNAGLLVKKVKSMT